MKLSDNLSALFVNIADMLTRSVTEIQIALQAVMSQAPGNIPQQTQDDIQQVCKSVATLQKGIDRFKTKELPELIQDATGIKNKLSVIRHDLRTPMNAIKGYGEIILEDLAGNGHPQLIENFSKVIQLSDQILANIIALNEAECIPNENLELIHQENPVLSENFIETATHDYSLDIATNVTRNSQDTLSTRATYLSPHQQNDTFGVLIPAQNVVGNFYHFYNLNKCQLGCCIGNVSDHSTNEALLKSVPQTIVNTLATADSSYDLVLSVRVANDLLIEMNDPLIFVTLIAAIFDPVTQTLYLVNAGHCEPLLVKQNGNIIELPGNGDHALGIVANMSYTESTYQIESGDTLFLYTNGLINVTNQKGETFGKEQLKKALSSCIGMSAKSTLSKLIVEVIKFSDQATLCEDLTGVVIKF